MILLLITYGIGIGFGWVLWGRSIGQDSIAHDTIAHDEGIEK